MITDARGADGPEMNILEKPFTEATLLARTTRRCARHSTRRAYGQPVSRRITPAR